MSTAKYTMAPSGILCFIIAPLAVVGMAKSVQEGDVFSVIHNDGQIVRVIEKDIEATKKMATLKKQVVVA